jgi:hypothetical protein
MIQLDSNSSKFWLIQKLPSLAPKIWSKIWMEGIWDNEQLSLWRYPQIQNGFWNKNLRSSHELKSRKIWLKILGDLEFDETCPTASFVHLIAKKIKFPAKADQKFEFLLKVEFGLTSQ